MSFTIIAALDAAGGIGKGGTIPWHLKWDLEHFRDVTTRAWVPGKQNVVIMGRTTWASLPERFRPLPERLNVVLSRQPLELPHGVLLASGLEVALEQAKGAAGKTFVIGGGSVYAQAIQLPSCTELYLTRIEGDFGCDIRFPELPSRFKLAEALAPLDENGVRYHFERYEA